MPNEFGGELTYSIFEIKQGQTITAYYAKKKRFVFGLTLFVKFYFLQADEVEAVLANTKQILNQFLQKSRILFILEL